MNPCSHPLVLRLIDLALEEDRVRDDATCALTVAGSEQGEAEIFVREDGVLCGAPLVSQIFIRLGWALEVYDLREDGAELKKNDRVCRLRGRYDHLLSAERTVLNFLMRLTGIATSVRRITKRHPGIEICDTRKTTPGWRLLEKYAVRVGGGTNHRMHLADMVLVKNNHIDSRSGGIRSVVSEVMQRKAGDLRAEVEVRDLAELRAVLDFAPDYIMLDNFSDTDVAAALKLAAESKSSSVIEVSGGITEERLSKLAALGVKRVSMGSLTYGPKSLDIAMHVRKH